MAKKQITREDVLAEASKIGYTLNAQEVDELVKTQQLPEKSAEEKEESEDKE